VESECSDGSAVSRIDAGRRSPHQETGRNFLAWQPTKVRYLRVQLPRGPRPPLWRVEELFVYTSDESDIPLPLASLWDIALTEGEKEKSLEALAESLRSAIDTRIWKRSICSSVFWHET
jgi:hypothetical protein